VPSVLEEVARVVVYVDLSGRHNLFETELTPLLYNASGEEISGVKVTPQKITVTVQLGRTGDSDASSP
jgi:YbbR domain-containing protein